MGWDETRGVWKKIGTKDISIILVGTWTYLIQMEKLFPQLRIIRNRNPDVIHGPRCAVRNLDLGFYWKFVRDGPMICQLLMMFRRLII